MVHKRYVYKNGKRYGPYYYHSYRDGDKVKKHYLKGVVEFSKLEFLLFAIGLTAFGLSAFALVKLFVMPLF